jgi:hypothetical protein
MATESDNAEKPEVQYVSEREQVGHEHRHGHGHHHGHHKELEVIPIEQEALETEDSDIKIGWRSWVGLLRTSMGPWMSCR